MSDCFKDKNGNKITLNSVLYRSILMSYNKKLRG